METETIVAGRELDEQVARALGWTQYKGHWVEPGTGDYGRGMCPMCPPHYSTDIGAAWQVEERIAALGLQHVYGAELAALVPPDPFFFGLIHATPEQRCRAALEALAHAPIRP